MVIKHLITRISKEEKNSKGTWGPGPPAAVEHQEGPLVLSVPRVRAGNEMYVNKDTVIMDILLFITLPPTTCHFFISLNVHQQVELSGFYS